MGYESCCCYNCEDFSLNGSEKNCKCLINPVYSREKCMNCPKRQYCAVTESPELFKDPGVNREKLKEIVYNADMDDIEKLAAIQKLINGA